ncbi:MAG: acyl-CoA dehydrogenase [Pseudohongiellaceae bacterium]
MASYRAPLRDMQFLLEEVFDTGRLFSMLPDGVELTSDLTGVILQEAARISEEVLAPINRTGDEEGCRFSEGQVTTPKGFPEAFKTFAEGGWVGLGGDPAYGGQGMPKTLSVLVEEMIMAANCSFALYPILTSGATMALRHHGTDVLKKRFMPSLNSGRWTGTMCLTEAHAGTDLGLLKTRAEPSEDGSYRISGTKIFITGGEHDLTENIVHLVLARMKGAPSGSHGLTMFVIPKKQVNEAGHITVDNGVSCGSIEHKMGIKASSTCVLNFDNATGYLVGEPNEGLACMFTMMNYERLSMGLQGTGLAENSYQTAVAYARERLQGRAPPPRARRSRQTEADPIIVHPDIRRMLLTMRANIMAGRALILYVAGKLDTAVYDRDADARADAEKLVALLTPVAKAWCTDCGYDACVLGQQVLGGHGYIREWGLEQNVRDARIAQIYEGTNGVQAQDLMGRKTVRNRGDLLQVLLGEIDGFLGDTSERPELKEVNGVLLEARRRLEDITIEIIERADNDPDEIGASAYPYLQLMGLVLYGFMWCRMIAAASAAAGADDHYYDGILKTGRFYLNRLMPRYKTLLEEISHGSGTLMAMKADQF